jgi:3D (Asp-Asp-Asp) domain-containing protein
MSKHTGIILYVTFSLLLVCSQVITFRYFINSENDIMKTPENKSKPNIEYNVRVSCYSATEEQCGNNNGITYTGDTVHFGGCAISPDLLMNTILKFGDTIILLGTPKDGQYVINDLSARHIKNTIDIYLPDTKKGGFCERGVIRLK